MEGGISPKMTKIKTDPKSRNVRSNKRQIENSITRRIKLNKKKKKSKFSQNIEAKSVTDSKFVY